MPFLAPFESWHLTKFANRDTGFPDDSRLISGQPGVAYTIVSDDLEILGCIGMMFMCEGVGIVWMVLSDGIMRYPVWLTRTARAMLRKTIEDYHIHRVEAAILSNNKRYQRWAESVGFKVDTEYLRYVRLK